MTDRRRSFALVVGAAAALSGGFKRPEACVELAKNKGIIASFSRALLNDLRHGMTDDEFNASLGQAIDDIYTASTKKTV